MRIIRRTAKLTRLATDAALGAGAAYFLDHEHGLERRKRAAATLRSTGQRLWERHGLHPATPHDPFASPLHSPAVFDSLGDD